MTEANKPNPEHDKLIEVLKFTPRTYKISMWGYGGEYVMGTVDRKVYDYFRKRRLDLSDYAWDDSYAEENEIPEDMQPFYPGQWYDCDGMAHAHGVDRQAGTIQIYDEQDQLVYERRLEEISGGEEDEPEISCNDEVYIGNKDDGTIVFIGCSNEKGTFFEGEINLREPFDITKLCLGYDDIDGNEIVNSVTYDDEDIDNWGGSTDGKSSDFGFYVAGSNKKTGSFERYKNMHDIEYPMTDWFPKKVKPVREGLYNVRTAGKNAWTHHAKWTGEKWTNEYNDDEVKIKEWQGIACDPDQETEDEVV